jgi:hypothetical protein
MKRILILALALAATTGCASGVKKQFTLTVDPPDAQITVIARADRPGESYHSPANISVRVPEDRSMAAQSRVVISRENYKTTVLPLSSVQGGSVRIKLAKALQYRLKYSLITPVRSEELAYQDKVLALRIIPREQNIELKLDNLTNVPLTVLWDTADYTDVSGRRHRIIHSGIKWEKRAERVPPQIIPPGGSLQEWVMPESSIAYSGEKKGYVAKPLFVLDNESALALKGRTVNLFLPIELDRAIIPNYSFTILIEDVIKE